jgi:hypothetical protein
MTWLGLVMLVAAAILVLLAFAQQARDAEQLREQVEHLAKAIPPLPAASSASEGARPRMFGALYQSEEAAPGLLSAPLTRRIGVAAVLALIGLVLNRPASRTGLDAAHQADLAALRAQQDSLVQQVASLRDSIRTSQLAAAAPRTPPSAGRTGRTPPTRNKPRPSAQASGPVIPALPAIAQPLVTAQ